MSCSQRGPRTHLELGLQEVFQMLRQVLWGVAAVSTLGLTANAVSAQCPCESITTTSSISTIPASNATSTAPDVIVSQVATSAVGCEPSLNSPSVVTTPLVAGEARSLTSVGPAYRSSNYRSYPYQSAIRSTAGTSFVDAQLALQQDRSAAIHQLTH